MAMAMTRYEKPQVREITAAEVMGRLGINAAIGEAEREASRQLWLANEMGNALDDKDAEIERLRAVNEKHHNDIKMLGRVTEEQAATIADLTANLEQIADIAEGSRTVNSLPHIAKIARAAALGRKEAKGE